MLPHTILSSRIWERKKKDLLRVSRLMYELDATRYTDHVSRAELYPRDKKGLASDWDKR
jgi:hypothetical protein